tara:strand:- start:270 stop:506 length:237 start_codon:yes stop_codon:yes gene_type:complete
MKYKQIKVDKETKQTDRYYRVNGNGEKVWYNEGLPFGIRTIKIGKDDCESIVDAEWFCTEAERDFIFEKYNEWQKEEA